MNYYQETYDNSFSYRLLIRLRDYAQHGHLPIKSKNENFYIDLYSISHTLHFNHNKKIKDEINRITQEIIEKYADTPTLSLTLTISEFVFKILSIYQKFWSIILPTISAATDKYNIVVNQNKNNIEKELFFYEIVDSTAHCIPIKNPTLEMLRENLAEANEVLTEYHNADEELKKV